MTIECEEERGERKPCIYKRHLTIKLIQGYKEEESFIQSGDKNGEANERNHGTSHIKYNVSS